MRKAQLVSDSVGYSISMFEETLLCSQPVEDLSALPEDVTYSQLLVYSLFLQVTWYIVVDPGVTPKQFDIGTQFIAERCPYEVLINAV